jgi:molybdopterin/thiamine biosynthesis adenylyltransferase
VELSNLNRQLLHWQDDAEASRMKVDSASDKLTSMNPGLKIWKHAARVQSSNISKILGDADILVDCTDNFETRMVMNDYAVRSGKPLVHGAVESLHGQITTVLPGKTPCLRCIFPKPPGRRGPIAVLGPAAGAIGAIQAAEVVKLITGVGEPLFGRLLVIDLLANCCEIIAFERDPDCISCKHVEG